MKMIDLPPIWLAAFAGIAWVQATELPLGLSFGGAWADFAGGLLVGGGIVLALLAAVEFRRHKTTIVPHQNATALITSGIYKRTRNPIYVADILILAGLILRWDAVLSLPLIPILVWVLEKRFIVPEENRLRRSFRADFARYENAVRRWV